MSYYWDNSKAWTCGMGPDENGTVSVTIGHEYDFEAMEESGDYSETFSFAFVDGALTIKCHAAMAKEIASAFAAVAEA